MADHFSSCLGYISSQKRVLAVLKVTFSQGGYKQGTKHSKQGHKGAEEGGEHMGKAVCGVLRGLGAQVTLPNRLARAGFQKRVVPS